MADEAVVRVRLSLAYDGADFSGWAAQPGLRTVQGELESALARVVRADPPPRVVVAGRTDAGVHARGQVAHVDIPQTVWEAIARRPGESPGAVLRRRLAVVLPDDVTIHAVDKAPAGFDARFSAVARHYSYTVSDGEVARDPLTRGRVLWHPRPLDVDAMSAAARTLTGLRDFAAFCRPREGATTIRDLTDFTWERVAAGADAGLIVARLRADAFCHSMVRSLVGALLAVGDGRRDEAWLTEVAGAAERSQAVSVAPPHALILEAVEYPPDGDLAARAAQTRAKRS